MCHTVIIFKFLKHNASNEQNICSKLYFDYTNNFTFHFFSTRVLYIKASEIIQFITNNVRLVLEFFYENLYHIFHHSCQIGAWIQDPDSPN